MDCRDAACVVSSEQSFHSPYRRACNFSLLRAFGNCSCVAYGVRWMYIRVHATNWRASCAPLFELSSAPSPHHRGPNCGALLRARTKRRMLGASASAAGMPPNRAPARRRASQSAAEITRQGDRDGSRSPSAGQDVLSRGPPSARSTGDLERRMRERRFAGVCFFRLLSLHKHCAAGAARTAQLAA